MSVSPAVQLVWFKRDLRVHDHAPLTEAAARGPVLCLYVYEPGMLQAPEFHGSHLIFLNASLAELDQALRERGARLHCRQGDITGVLDALHRAVPFEALWSHEETGNGWSFERDRAVTAWCRAHGVPWHERPQTGVVRRLRAREGWARRWDSRMRKPVLPPPARLQTVPLPPALAAEGDGPREAAQLGVAPGHRPEAQPGGERAARACLESFLAERGVGYQAELSSPVTAWNGCSRLSPYLAFGCLSMRSVYRATLARRSELLEARARDASSVDSRWGTALRAFEGRLRWHCHFMQKLEDEPRIEFENFIRAYDGLRENDFREDHFAAWCAGETGYPMVDACMRALAGSGWINFRMRAMLVSFAAHHLWLHWRRPAVFLARRFLDFEPGIHYSQFQMQSGTTGINTIRIYSPTKQLLDHDPEGVFVRRWLPELARVPARYLAEPARMPVQVQQEAGCRIGRDYPAPVVVHEKAYAAARQRMAEARRAAGVREQARSVYRRHGSRRRPPARRPAGRD